MKRYPLVAIALSSMFIVGDFSEVASAQNLELNEKNVLASIERGRKAMLSQQSANGSWESAGSAHLVGETALAALALIYSGMESDAPEIQ